MLLKGISNESKMMEDGKEMKKTERRKEREKRRREKERKREIKRERERMSVWVRKYKRNEEDKDGKTERNKET